jgi:hypothetical protein
MVSRGRQQSWAALVAIGVVGLGFARPAFSATQVLKCTGQAQVTDATSGRVSRQPRTETFKIGDKEYYEWREAQGAWSVNYCAEPKTSCTSYPGGGLGVVSVQNQDNLTVDDTFGISATKQVQHKIESSDGAGMAFTGRCALAPDPAKGG